VNGSPATDPPRRRHRGGPWKGPLPYLSGLLVLYLLIPIAALLVRLASSAGAGLPTAGLASALWVSLITASISATIIALLGTPLGWFLAQARGRVWEVVGVAVQLPLALPPLMSGILLVELVGPYSTIGQLFGGRLTDTMAGIVIAQTFVAAPFLVVAARSAFATVDPGLLDVAATLGHGSWSRFFRVSLPLAAPGIRAGLLLSWLRAFGEFGATVILAYHPYSLPVFTYVQFTSTGLPSTLAPTAGAIAAAVVVLGLARWRPGRWIWARCRPHLGGRRHLNADLPAAGRSPERRPAATIGRVQRTAGDGPRTAGDAPDTPQVLDFDLRARIGSFDLELAHTAHAPHLALLGPSGAGKSFALRCLAGLRGAGVGRVALGRRDLSRMTPEERRIGWVPQDAALFPHLSVWRQLTFGVGTDLTLAVHWLERLGLLELKDRLPSQLSGGQRQRVSLARALARDPDLVLLDEPFSSLDRPVRDELRRVLRRLQQTLGVATVLVTHDPEEAALLADEVVILADGRALQSGTRTAVFERPASPRVARLLAIDNLRTGVIAGSGRLVSDHTELAIRETGLTPGTTVSWCIRSEHVVLLPEMVGGAEVPLPRSVSPSRDAHFALAATCPAVILEVFDLGAWREVTVCLDGGLELTARTVDGHRLLPDQRCRVALAPEVITLWTDAPKRSGL